MKSKSLIWVGMSVGSTVGGLIPKLWGGDLISYAGLLLSGAGGIAGIWLGSKLGNYL